MHERTKLNLFLKYCALLLAALVTFGSVPVYAEPHTDSLKTGSVCGEGDCAYYLRFSGTEAHSADFHVNFSKDNSVLNLEYMNTGENLRALADSIASIRIRGGTVDSLTVVSYSSPEGNYLYNERLSGSRAASMRKYLEGEYPGFGDRLRVTPDGESWNMFRRRALTDSTVTEAQRERLISIIDADTGYETKKALIKSWDNALWNRIVRVWFTDMRRSFIRLDWSENVYVREYFLERPTRPEGQALTSGGVLAPRTGSIILERTILALKTNLLYDLVTALNFEVEVPLGDRFSIMVEDVFPWWTFGPNGNKYSFEMWEMGIEPRWWFARTDSRDRLSGHFIAPYVMSGRYDFQWDSAMNYQGEYWSAGVSYGYAMPIGRLFNLEFSASVGFVSADYRHYQPAPDYSVLYRDPFETGVLSYFGPTKLKVSLVLPITVKRTYR